MANDELVQFTFIVLNGFWVFLPQKSMPRKSTSLAYPIEKTSIDPLLTIPKTFFHKCSKSTHKLNTLFFLDVLNHELQERQQRREPA